MSHAKDLSQRAAEETAFEVCMGEGVLLAAVWVRALLLRRWVASLCLMAEGRMRATTGRRLLSSSSRSVSESSSRVLSFFPIIDLL